MRDVPGDLPGVPGKYERDAPKKKRHIPLPKSPPFASARGLSASRPRPPNDVGCDDGVGKTGGRMAAGFEDFFGIQFEVISSYIRTCF